MQVARIKDAAAGRLRIALVEQAGYETVLSVLETSDYQLGRSTASERRA